MIQTPSLAGMWLPEWRLPPTGLLSKTRIRSIPRSGTLIALLFCSTVVNGSVRSANKVLRTVESLQEVLMAAVLSEKLPARPEPLKALLLSKQGRGQVLLDTPHRSRHEREQ